MDSMRVVMALLALALLHGACGPSSPPPVVNEVGVPDDPPPVGEPADEPDPEPDEPAVAPRRISAFEIDPPYLSDVDAFWARTDLYVMQPDIEPLERWPDEVLKPSEHGVRVIVLLPGDYRTRSNGSLPPGVLYIADSGTAEQPLLVTYAPAVGADILKAPHPAERLGTSQAQLVGFRVWNQTYQYFHGLTFADGVSACLMRETSGTVIDRCLWHNTGAQPLRIRFGANHCLVQRCVMQRFNKDSWGHGDTVAINLSDGACTHNRIVSNVILNFTDSYQHTDREGEDYGLGAGTIVDNNFMGFTKEAYLQEPNGELMCGENTIDMKMGGTAAEPVRVTNNVFFGVRAAKAGCAASGSGGYAVTTHRRGTWIEMTDNLFIDCDSGVFLNAYFLNADPSQGRIDPHLTFRRNIFSGVKSYATAFPSRTGRVMSGMSAAVFADNHLIECERLMEREPLPRTGDLVVTGNRVYGTVELAPRDEERFLADGNTFHDATVPQPATVVIPWVNRTLTYRAPPE